MQKIIRVRENDPIRQLDEHTETWHVVRVVWEQTDYLGHRWYCVLLERDEEASAEKLAKHEEYLRMVSRLSFPKPTMEEIQ